MLARARHRHDMLPRWTSLVTLAVSSGLGLLPAACSRQVQLAPLAVSAPTSGDGSALCEGLAGRFIGLPEPASAVGPASAVPALTGRWWVRSCSAEAVSGELRIRLAGPG